MNQQRNSTDLILETVKALNALAPVYDADADKFLARLHEDASLFATEQARELGGFSELYAGFVMSGIIMALGDRERRR